MLDSFVSIVLEAFFWEPCTMPGNRALRATGSRAVHLLEMLDPFVFQCFEAVFGNRAPVCIPLGSTLDSA